MKGGKNFSYHKTPKKFPEKKKRLKKPFKGSRERKETKNAVASLAVVMLVK
jgi:hypothetical protein